MKSFSEILNKIVEIEEQDAKESGSLGYMAKVFIQATLPHSDPKTSFFERKNGKYSLSIISHPKVGVPYGVYPRLMLLWLVTEAVRTKSQTLNLGSNLSSFMNNLGLIPTGGKYGTTPRFREQLKRLFSSTFSFTYSDKGLIGGAGLNIARDYKIWWDPKNPDQLELWNSTVTLGYDFFQAIIEKPVPVDVRALRTLKTSSMALDLYCWLTYRLSYLKYPLEVNWDDLQSQFGCDYAKTRQGKYSFKKRILEQLKKVLAIYRDANIEETSFGLKLKPSLPHVRKEKFTLHFK